MMDVKENKEEDVKKDLKEGFTGLGLSDECIQRITDYLYYKALSMNSKDGGSVYETHMRQVCRYVDSDDLLDFDLDDYILRKQYEYAPKTLRTRYFAIKKYFEYLNEKKEMDVENPAHTTSVADHMNDVQEPVKNDEFNEDVVYLTEEQVSEILDHVRKPKIRNELIIRFAFELGLRREQICRLELDNLDFEDREWEVYSTKSDDTHTVFPNSRLNLKVKKWVKNYRDSFTKASESEYLFPTHRSKRISEKTITEIFNKAIEQSNVQNETYEDSLGRDLKKYTFHSLRHGFANRMEENGASLEQIRSTLNHYSVEITEMYLDQDDEDVKRYFEEYARTDL